MPGSVQWKIAMMAAVAAAFCVGQSAPNPDPQAKDAQAQMKGLTPRASAADYQAQAKAGTVTIAAEFDAHAVSTPEGIYSTEDYVAVEVAFFGEGDMPLRLAQGDFSIRINGKPMPSPAEPYARIFPSLKDLEWEPPASASKAGKTSLGGGGQDLNAPPPAPPKMPFELKRAMQQKVQKAALPEGDRPLPVAGLIFFPYRGKADGIRTVELMYEGAAGKATLALHP